MTTNSSFNTSASSFYDIFSLCFVMPSSYYHTIAFNLVNVPFILPLCLYILYLGIQQWKSRAKTSHTDFFTYNMVVIQLLGIFASCVLTLNLLFKSKMVVKLAIFMFYSSYSAVIVFQTLTCLERYMAVVHPVTYLRLKSQTWTFIRNISCVYVWLQCVIEAIFLLTIDDINEYSGVAFFGLSLSLVLVLFCNFCVLRALIRPGPGEVAKKNQSKQRALYTITAITGTLLLKFGGDLLSVMSFTLMTFDDHSCALWFSDMWFTLPSTLLLPLLFLHRNGKLLCFKNKHVTSNRCKKNMKDTCCELS